jgi:hypothetical protein
MIAISKNKNAQQPSKVLIKELLTRVEGNVTLLIEEANLALEINQYITKEKIEKRREILASSKQLMKESRKV